MKKSIYGIALIAIQLWATPGCLDNSYHLTKLFDYKNYHYTSCNCPCEKQYKILANRGQCSKCLHYRDPQYIQSLHEPHAFYFEMPTAHLENDSLVGFPKQLLKNF